MTAGVVFQNCYVIEQPLPEAPENTPPAININAGKIVPAWDELVDVDLEQGGYLVFKVSEIFEPDAGDTLYGKYAIDYDPVDPWPKVANIFTIGRKTGEENRYLWEAEFKIQNAETAVEKGCHEVMAVFSDREWEIEKGEFAVPDATKAAMVRWKIRVYKGSEGKMECQY